ncbi:MAG: ISL3 family transposase [Methanosarcinaceae archaeon]|nr:ISL3 family transposase [Methanosarcinaceae archaeon]
MKDIELYRQLLGIKSPWTVNHVSLNMEEVAVYVYLVEASEATWCCPTCGEPATLYDHREERIWRHLDSCQFHTYLVAAVPRVNCATHGVLTADVPWSAPHSRFTLLFERFAIDVLLATQVQAKTAGLLGLTSSQVHDLMERAVLRGLKRRDEDEVIDHLTLDEKSFQHGHQYMTVLGDANRGRVLDVCETRTKDATSILLTETLTVAQRNGVRSITMDMWEAFMNAAQTIMTQADIIHDRFHTAQYLNAAVDKTRRTEHKTLLQQDCSTLKNSKYLWLKGPDNFTDTQRERFADLRDQDLATAKVWSFKETFRSFFACKTVDDGHLFFTQWYEDAVSLGNTHLTKVADMLKRHLPGLLAYLRHHRTNAMAESLNSRIQHIKACAHGFRRFSGYRIAILFFLGKLALYPQESS